MYSFIKITDQGKWILLRLDNLTYLSNHILQSFVYLSNTIFGILTTKSCVISLHLLSLCWQCLDTLVNWLLDTGKHTKCEMFDWCITEYCWSRSILTQWNKHYRFQLSLLRQNSLKFIVINQTFIYCGKSKFSFIVVNQNFHLLW
jgi:hypothetical protein